MKPARMIAIDGPAASGKSTIAQRVAKRMGFLFFDTGVMYRAVTWAVLSSNISMDDESSITRLANQIQIDVDPPSKDDGRAYDVLLNGEDITWEVRRMEVEENVSKISAYPGVRKAMTEQQRRIGLRGDVVMVGRDIGTVVLPEADVKIYLIASVEERARRRYTEIIGRGETADYDSILESMRKRDEIDSTRAVAPLKPAKDAVILDSDRMTIEEVVQKVMDIIQ